MAKALTSAVDIVLDGDTYQLVPSLKAANAVSRQFEGFLGAFQAIGNLSMDAYTQICRAGIHRDLISNEELAQAVFRTGLPKLSGPLSTFVVRLQNGGRDPDEGNGDDDAATDNNGDGDEGNGRN